MSIDEKREPIAHSELSVPQLQKVLFFFCAENLRLKRVSVRKNAGNTFLQKGMAKMQEAGIPHLNYLFTLDRLACEFSPDLQSDYDKLQRVLQEAGLNRSQLFEEAKEIVKSIFGTELCSKIEQIADSLKNVEVSDLISQSHKKDEEEVRRSKLFYLNPEATNVLGLKELDVEAEIKERWIKSLRKNKPIPTADLTSIRLGKLAGQVKATGFFIPIDYLFGQQGDAGKIVTVFGDSRRDLSQGCICFINQNITIQAFSQYENMLPEGKFLVVGEIVPNIYNNQVFTQSSPEVAKAPFALNAMAILQVILGCHTVITSVDRCVEEIKYYAKKDSYEAFQKLFEIKNKGKNYKPKTVVRKIRDFCKCIIKDGEVYPKEHVQPPSETLKSGQGDCKAKVCLAYSMFLHENFVEKLDLVLLDTEGVGKPNHVQIEVKINGVSLPITLELTGNSSAFKREISRFTLPLYTN